MSADFEYLDEGSISLLTPLSEAAENWVQTNLPSDAMRFGSSYVIEHRYVSDILLGLHADGLEVA